MPVWSGEQSAVDLGVIEDVFVTIPRGQGENLTASVDVEEAVTAPLVGGQIMGVVNVTLDSDLIYRGDVVAMQAIEQGGLFKRFIDWLTLFFSNLFS